MKVFQLFGVLFWGVTHNVWENELFGGHLRLLTALFLVTIVIIAIVSNNHS